MPEDRLEQNSDGYGCVVNPAIVSPETGSRPSGSSSQNRVTTRNPKTTRRNRRRGEPPRWKSDATRSIAATRESRPTSAADKRPIAAPPSTSEGQWTARQTRSNIIIGGTSQTRLRSRPRPSGEPERGADGGRAAHVPRGERMVVLQVERRPERRDPPRDRPAGGAARQVFRTPRDASATANATSSEPAGAPRAGRGTRARRRPRPRATTVAVSSTAGAERSNQPQSPSVEDDGATLHAARIRGSNGSTASASAPQTRLR